MFYLKRCKTEKSVIFCHMCYTSHFYIHIFTVNSGQFLHLCFEVYTLVYTLGAYVQPIAVKYSLCKILRG